MSGFPLFHPLVQQWFSESIGSPTDVQRRAWPEIARHRNVLVTAPTGSGKTLAAFLWGLNQLITGAWPLGTVRALYVSPLKALNNDVQRNLLGPLAELRTYFTRAGKSFPEISVLTRSGDTPDEERRRMARRPPEVLITTPESLNLLLSSKSGRAMLTGVATVILDEIHAVVGTKRGTHLITAVDRLVPLSGEFQRIALSATMNPPERAADFVGGFRRIGKAQDFHYEKRPVAVVRSDDEKAYQLRIAFPSPDSGAAGDSIWTALTAAWKKIIAEHDATLLFANSRRHVEKVARFLNENEPEEIAYAHHGSLSREIRLAVEGRLKRGELKAIVATNSLELGIDIGALDQVVLIQTPRTVSSVLQRIGRSGHGVGRTSHGLLFPTHGMDLVHAAVIARAVREQDTEEVRPVQAPLDVLAQVLLSMTAMERWNIDELYSFIRTSHPYFELPRKHFDLVLDMLAGRYADSRLRELQAHISIDRMDNTVQARADATFLLYSSGGTIPERGYFDLRLRDTRAKIGELDEEFVWERSIGETFTLGSQLWRIEDITHNDVEVVPARNATGIFPFWRAEEQNREFHLSEKIALFLEHADGRIDSPDFKQELQDRHALEDAAADELIRFLKHQRDATGERLPHRHGLLVEHVDDPVSRSDMKQVILHTLWGGRVNRPFCLALSAAWEEKFRVPLQVISNDDAVLLLLPPEIPVRDLFRLVTPENVKLLLREKLDRTGFFGARFRESAERALLLPKASFKKRMPLWLIRLRSKKLLEAVKPYEDFPVLIETWRTCLQDEFDLESLEALLEELRDGRISLRECTTGSASPFAGGLAWKRTNTFLYDDDTPLMARESALRPELIRELLFSSHLRPRIAADLIRTLDQKIKRTSPGYAPGSAQELADWIKERLLIPEPEWRELADAVRRDHGENATEWLRDHARKLAWIAWQGAPCRFLAGIELLPRLLAAFRLTLPDLTLGPVSSVVADGDLELTARAFLARAAPPEGYGLSDFLSAWLAYYGPVEKGRVQELLRVTAERLDEALEPLIEAQELVMDRFGERSTSLEVCDSENLERLLRMARRSRQPSFEALPIEQLPLFLAVYQGIVTKGETLDDLRQRIEHLFGWPAPVEAWEESLLPARMHPYRGELLDSLLTNNDLVWFGCGRKRISLAFAQDVELFRRTEISEADSAELAAFIPDRHGRYSLFDITERSRSDSAAVTELLWRQAWKGNVTSDTFHSIRKGIMTGFATPAMTGDARRLSRRSGFNRWKVARPLEGHWRRIDDVHGSGDALAREELVKDRIRQLFRRYGILFRELLARELPYLRWRELIRSLRLMELSGEILTGHFFRGISGLQFISPEAFRMLQEPLPQDRVFWSNAMDPASLCGVPMEPFRSLLPLRVSSTFLVYRGCRLVMVSRRFGKDLIIHGEPGDAALQDHLAFFQELTSREFNPPKFIRVESINGEPALRSPHAEAMKHAGFHAARRGWEFWKAYV
jgi:ATP-dependent Lhr-like helicase